MTVEQPGMSVEGFKIRHLQQRIAHITLMHEEELTNAAVHAQLLTQQRDELLTEVARLRKQYEPEDSTDQPEPPE
jgi:hypothetical protein